ncbi:MAG: flagellar protein FliT [Cellvibrionaceae bacterium]
METSIKNGNVIIKRCKDLIEMARHDEWGDFEKKLYERDMLINKSFSNVDVMKLTNEDKNDLSTIQRLNDDIKSIVIAKQKEIQNSLLAETHRNKAHQAYQQQ